MSVWERDVVAELHTLSGKETLDRILNHPHPQALVRNMAYGDFYWLIKKVGEEDCLPLLENASSEQWQYLLDMELWERDRLDLSQTLQWLDRLEKADARRLAKWFFHEGRAICYYFFFRTIQVEIKDNDEAAELPDDFFTLDGVYHIRALIPEERSTIENLLRNMAKEDPLRYQALLLGLAGVLPAETEEKMYRMKNVRLAEHGFLPFEEAVSVYSPLSPETLKLEDTREISSTIAQDTVPRELVPLLPFYHLEGKDTLTAAIKGFFDPLLMDRLHLEFAGLCNQILSADGLEINDVDVLSRTCRKAAGYLNLGLEKVCKGDISKARQLLENHPLISFFRVGFGLALKLKWRAERWMEKSWFLKQGLDLTFWGEEWGETLKGLLLDKPLFYRGGREEIPYRDFRGFSELEECMEILGRVEAMDHLLEQLSLRSALPRVQSEDPELTFYRLIFGIWSRHFLGLPLSFEGVSAEQAGELFRRLRAGDASPPYRMAKFENIFISDIIHLAGVLDAGEESLVRDLLHDVWQAFSDEYQFMPSEHLDARFSKYLNISPSPAFGSR